MTPCAAASSLPKSSAERADGPFFLCGGGCAGFFSESVTAALAIAYYCQDVEKAAFLCANMGGDTDTIGSMACAICGAFNGLSSIKNETISYLEKTNFINFADLADKIIKARASFIKE